MPGYWNNPEETARAIDADGWLRTGDIAIMRDDGYLRIVDRKKDLILVSGFQRLPQRNRRRRRVSPGDRRSCRRSDVANKKSGEAVRLIVVSKDPQLDAEAVLAWCRERLTGYKVPRSIVFTDELPKSNVGKILRRDVRERFGSN